MTRRIIRHQNNNITNRGLKIKNFKTSYNLPKYKQVKKTSQKNINTFKNDGKTFKKKNNKNIIKIKP